MGAFVLGCIDAMAHDSWINRGGHRNAAGEWCCGEGDKLTADRERSLRNELAEMNPVDVEITSIAAGTTLPTT